MAVSNQVTDALERSSWVRAMFEVGRKLKTEHGAENVLDFTLGNPDLDPPAEFSSIVNEIISEAIPNKHSYMPNGGYPDVREAIARRVSSEYSVEMDADHLLMACGAGGGLNVVMKSILNRGDRVLTPTPFFMEYEWYVDNHGGRLELVPGTEDLDIDVDAIAAKIGPDVAAVLINSPNNPSGSIYPSSTIRALGEMLAQRSREVGRTVYLVSDEPYRHIVYDDHTVPSVFDYYENSIVVSSYSKELSIPGERIGWIAVDPRAEDAAALVGAMILCTRILGFVNAPALMQRVVGRLTDVRVDIEPYRRRRDMICAGLEEIGFDFTAPQGTFYCFPKSPVGDELQFVEALQKELILVVPGRGFGAPGNFRISFCVPEETIQRSFDGFRRAFEQFQ